MLHIENVITKSKIKCYLVSKNKHFEQFLYNEEDGRDQTRICARGTKTFVSKYQVIFCLSFYINKQLFNNSDLFQLSRTLRIVFALFRLLQRAF